MTKMCFPYTYHCALSPTPTSIYSATSMQVWSVESSMSPPFMNNLNVMKINLSNNQFRYAAHVCTSSLCTKMHSWQPKILPLSQYGHAKFPCVRQNLSWEMISHLKCQLNPVSSGTIPSYILDSLFDREIHHLIIIIVQISLKALNL